VRIAIVGTGAVGGLIGARLAHAGEAVTLIDVGTRQEALRRDGLTLVAPTGERIHAEGAVVGELGDAGVQDLVVLAVKAYDLPAVAEHLPPLYHEHTRVLTVQNGLPWWYFQRVDGPWTGRRVESLDPTGSLERHVPAHRIVGAVVYPAADVVGPGVVRHVEGNRIVVGELDDRPRERTQAVIDLLIRGGFKSFFLEDLRGELWLKLMGSAVFNPLSALTHATMVDICRFGPSRSLSIELMREVQAVAAAFGVTIRLPIEKRLAGAERVGRHKTSTLQDVEQGRRLEVDALIGAVVEIAAWVGVPTPKLEAIAAATRLLDRTLREERVAIKGRPLIDE
jgi:2-dehydropantoate 2-reductase